MSTAIKNIEKCGLTSFAISEYTTYVQRALKAAFSGAAHTTPQETHMTFLATSGSISATNASARLFLSAANQICDGQSPIDDFVPAETRQAICQTLVREMICLPENKRPHSDDQGYKAEL